MLSSNWSAFLARIGLWALVAGMLSTSQALRAGLFDDTFSLHSNPGASQTIYLDFNGHNGFEGNYTAFDFDGSPGTFSVAELTEIQLAWQSVSEDFFPFDVNVTTADPGIEALRKRGAGDTEWGSHEAGHALGLGHDGGGGDGEYWYGHGTPGSATYYSAIMGWTRTQIPTGVSQWSIGEYDGANNTEDDLAIITTRNGFGYRADDHGSSTGSATPLSSGVAEEGIIERNTDLDFFSFAMPSSGNVQLAIAPDNLAPNLDILAKLHDAGGAVLYTSNPSATLNAEFDVSLPAGDYYLSIDGTGVGDPATNGYSDYGSLGYYSIELLTPLPDSADFDRDGDVDGDDFLEWQATFGINDGGDADGDGDTDGDDFLMWQSAFHSGSGAATAVVPEPMSMALAVLMAMIGPFVPRGRIERLSR